MKKISIISIALFLSLLYIQAQEKKDTTLIFNQKRVIIQDSVGQMKVRVMDKDSAEYKKVYEAIFTDKSTFERFNVIEEIGFNFPFLKKKHHGKEMEAHWAGLSFAKLTTSDSEFHIGETGGIPLNKAKSNEVMFNVVEEILPVIGHTFGFTSGFGLNWRSYHLENNSHLINDNGFTKAEAAPVGITYDYSRLRTLHLTLPVLLEWQPVFGKNKEFFMSAGVIGGWNVMSTYRVKYKNADGDKINKIESHGLNTNPLTLDFMGQIGYDMLSIYAKYSPMGVFQKGKGPDVNATSLGIILHI